MKLKGVAEVAEEEGTRNVKGTTREPEEAVEFARHGKTPEANNCISVILDKIIYNCVR